MGVHGQWRPKVAGVALVFAVAVTPAVPAGWRALTGGSVQGLHFGWGALVTATLVPVALLTAPMVADFRRHPRENYKQATLLTRGAHEHAGFKGPSIIHTAWLWRHAPIYDPRGDTKVRSLEELEERCRRSLQEGGEFYMIVGMRHLSEAVFPELMQRLRDPRHFDHLTTLWGGEPLNTLEVYRWRRDATTPSNVDPAESCTDAGFPPSWRQRV